MTDIAALIERLKKAATAPSWTWSGIAVLLDEAADSLSRLTAPPRDEEIEWWKRQAFKSDSDAALIAFGVATGLKLAKADYGARDERPCGECHLQPGEVCDICGRRALAHSESEGKEESA